MSRSDRIAFLLSLLAVRVAYLVSEGGLPTSLLCSRQQSHHPYETGLVNRLTLVPAAGHPHLLSLAANARHGQPIICYAHFVGVPLF